MQLSHALRMHPKEVVVLVGGGGKTTLMFRLADELAVSGRRVVTTMTTRIFVGQMLRAPRDWSRKTKQHCWPNCPPPWMHIAT